MMAQVVGFMPPTWRTQIPGSRFSPGLALAAAGIQGVNDQIRVFSHVHILSPYLPHSTFPSPAFQIAKQSLGLSFIFYIHSRIVHSLLLASILHPSFSLSHPTLFSFPEMSFPLPQTPSFQVFLIFLCGIEGCIVPLPSKENLLLRILTMFVPPSPTAVSHYSGTCGYLHLPLSPF